MQPEEEWVVIAPQRPVFLFCTPGYDAPGLVDHLRAKSTGGFVFVYEMEKFRNDVFLAGGYVRVVLNASDEVLPALPEMAIACKNAGAQLIVVGNRQPVDWMRAFRVDPTASFETIEQMLRNQAK